MKTITILILAAALAACGSTKAIDRGQALFNAETFGGNGRTCATCHRAADGFGLSPKTITALPKSDPLFVDVPGLENGIELIGHGLILVRDADEDGVNELRPTPGLGGLRKLCNRDGQCVVLGQRGDRETDLCKFSNEAIGNHMTKAVPGVEGKDFRLMSAQECKDMIAFLRSRRVSK